MNDLFHIETLLKILRRGKYEMTGEELIVFYRTFEYLVSKRKELLEKKQAMENPVQQLKPVVQEDPIKVEPKQKKKKS